MKTTEDICDRFGCGRELRKPFSDLLDMFIPAFRLAKSDQIIGYTPVVAY